jgi:hypothetical protein
VKTLRFCQTLAAFIVLSFPFGNSWATSPEQEDWEAARKASCPELIDAYKTTIAAERKVVAAMKESKNGTIATNVLGVASLAILGIGFFSWNDNASAEENLADLRNDLNIITTVASEKKCELPVTTDKNAK